MIVQFKNPTFKRFALALLVAFIGAVILVTTAEAQVYKPNPCLGLGPGDPMYWLLSCWAM